MNTQQAKLFEKWVSPDEFSCKICNQYTTKRRDTFTAHINRKHKTGIKEYESKYGKITETRHKCKECHTDVLHDKVYLKMHFDKQHQGQMTTEEYFLKHVVHSLDFDLEAEESENDPTDPIEEEFLTWANMKKYTCQLCHWGKKRQVKYLHTLFSHVDTVHNMEPKVYEEKFYSSLGMKHECKRCGYQARTIGHVVYHATKAHNMTAPQYLEEYEPNEDRHKCKVCHKNMSKQRLSSHFELRDAHQPRLTLREYYDNYIREDGTAKFSLRAENKENIGPKKTNVSLTVSQKRKGLFQRCDQSKPSPSSRPNSSVTWGEIQEWANQCVYSCTVCRKYTGSHMDYVKTHLKKVHGIDLKVEKSGNKEVSVELKYHRCHLCQAAILFKKANVKGHVENGCSGSMTLRDYYINYIANGDPATEEKRSQDALQEVTMEKSFYAWAEKCLWNCPICDYTTQSGGNFASHLQKKHKQSFKSMKGQGIEASKMLMQSEVHECKLCGKESWLDSMFLKQHVAIHDLTGVQYFKKHVLENAAASEEGFAKSAHMRNSHLDRLMYDWTRGVSYICHICGHRCAEPDGFKMHLFVSHKIQEKDYSRVYHPYVMHHICKMCGKQVPHRRSEIKRHLLLAHSPVTIQEYFKEHILDDLKLRQVFGLNKYEMVNVKGLDLGIDNDYKKWLRQLPIYCKLCGQDQICFYKIPAFLKHLRISHDNMTKEDYEDKFGGYWSPEELRFHACKPCGGKLILKIVDRLNWHATDAHKVSLQEYFNKFVIKKTFSAFLQF